MGSGLILRLERAWALFQTRAKGKPDFYDKLGFPYWLWVDEAPENEEGWSSWILSSHQKLPVGIVKLLWSDTGEMKLCDIVLDAPEVRGRGVGSILLQRVLTYGKAKGMRRVYGRIVQEDVAGTPYLLDWYRKHGFEITFSENEQSHEIATIMREL